MMKKDNLLIIINYDEKKTKIFLKGVISSKPIVKNLTFVNKSGEKIEYLNILNYLKKEILELSKISKYYRYRRPCFFKC